MKRQRVHFLVDSSKRVTWAREVMRASHDLDVHLIHLIRDPRGWYASESRRRAGTVEEMTEGWLRENIEIRQFLSTSGRTSSTVLYEDLAHSPETRFPLLCREIGCDYDPAALQYWTKEHHAFAANGASSSLLSPLPGAQDFRCFVTGDDEYYRTHDRTSFTDQRWRKQLTQDVEHRILHYPGVRSFLDLVHHEDRSMAAGKGSSQ